MAYKTWNKIKMFLYWMVKETLKVVLWKANNLFQQILIRKMWLNQKRHHFFLIRLKIDSKNKRGILFQSRNMANRT